MVDDSARIERQPPPRQAVLNERSQRAGSREVLKEGIGPIASTDNETARIFDHKPEKRVRKRLNERLMINRDSVGSSLHIGMSDNVTDAFVRVLIQQFPNRRAGLARLADERTKTAREHPLCSAILTNN